MLCQLVLLSSPQSVQTIRQHMDTDMDMSNICSSLVFIIEDFEKGVGGNNFATISHF